METKTLKKYQHRLHEMRDRLTGDIDRIAENIAEEVNTPGEIVNVGFHNADHDTEGLTREVALEKNETDMLEEVVAALNRIDDGTYGTCTNCGEAIAPARLDAIPYTPHCRDCQEKLESESEDWTPPGGQNR